MKFTIYQVISYLNKLENKNRKFKRVGDEKFIIFRGNIGDLMYQLNEFIKPLPIFLYMQDEWELIEE
jgi:hypothetical protein